MASISRIKVCRKVAPLRTHAASCEEPESRPPRPVGLLAGSWRCQRLRGNPLIGILAKRWNQVSVVFSRSRLHVGKPLQDGGPTLRKSWLKKRACYDTRALPFRQLPETFFDAPPPTFPPQLGALPNGRERTQMARQKTRRFYTSKLKKSTARTLQSGVSPITPRRPHAHAGEIPGFEAPTTRRRTLKQLLPRPDKHPETAHSPQPRP